MLSLRTLMEDPETELEGVKIDRQDGDWVDGKKADACVDGGFSSSKSYIGRPDLHSPLSKPPSS